MTPMMMILLILAMTKMRMRSVVREGLSEKKPRGKVSTWSKCPWMETGMRHLAPHGTVLAILEG